MYIVVVIKCDFICFFDVPNIVLTLLSLGRQLYYELQDRVPVDSSTTCRRLAWKAGTSLGYGKAST